MPHIKLDDEDTKHAITYLPLVGALIGLITCGAFRLFLYADIPAFVKACITVIIPIAVTGGFHIDGFLDTADALASYRSNEKKLEILKDPHIGSFAVISFCVCILLMLGTESFSAIATIFLPPI